MKPLDKNTAFAIKALSTGTANDGQQKAALAWILFDVCRLREPSFAPGEKPLETAFNEGRRHVGLMIAGAIEAQPASVRQAPKRRNQRQEAK